MQRKPIRIWKTLYVKSSYRRRSAEQIHFASLKIAVSTLLGEIILIKLLCDFINVTGEVNQWTELPFKSIQSSINCGNIYLVSGNAAPGGMLRFSLTDGGMICGAASELLKNEKCMSVESSAWQYGTLPEKRFYSLIHCEEALASLIQSQATWKYLQENLERKIKK